MNPPRAMCCSTALSNDSSNPDNPGLTDVDSIDPLGVLDAGKSDGLFGGEVDTFVSETFCTCVSEDFPAHCQATTSATANASSAITTIRCLLSIVFSFSVMRKQ